MKIIFFGSDDLAQTCLEALIRSGHKVLACVTQPDKPKGRALSVTPTFVKDLAVKHGMDVLQPTDLKDKEFLSRLKSSGAELFVVIAYGRILTDEILSIPTVFSINLHASLLPKYRGAAPINWAILNGEKETGLSVIKISAKLDEGDILAQKNISIDINDNAMSLKEKMKDEGKRLLLDTIQSIQNGEFCLVKQDHGKATIAPKLSKEMGRINWKKDAVLIHNSVRGLLPWPTAYTQFDGKTLKILETKVIEMEQLEGVPGEVVAVLKDGFVVRCGHGALLVKKVHPDSSRVMDAKSFLSGHKIGMGFKLI